MTNLPNSTSERSPPLEKSLEQFPFISLLLLDLESEAQALATDWTRCSSSAFLQPHQLTSGCPQREITAPLLWCLKRQRAKRTAVHNLKDQDGKHGGCEKLNGSLRYVNSTVQQLSPAWDSAAMHATRFPPGHWLSLKGKSRS